MLTPVGLVLVSDKEPAAKTNPPNSSRTSPETASEVPVEMALSELPVEASRFAQLTLSPPTDELY